MLIVWKENAKIVNIMINVLDIKEGKIMLVKATDKYEKLNLKDNELNRIPKKGEEFEVSKERYKVLTQTNKFNVAFVEKVEQNKEIETATKKVKTEKAIKKTTTKKTVKKDK